MPSKYFSRSNSTGVSSFCCTGPWAVRHIAITNPNVVPYGQTAMQTLYGRQRRRSARSRLQIQAVRGTQTSFLLRAASSRIGAEKGGAGNSSEVCGNVLHLASSVVGEPSLQTCLPLQLNHSLAAG